MLSAYCTIACTLAMQPCPAALPSSLARQPCPAALLGSLAQQFDQFRPDLMRALARSLRSHRTVLQWQVTKLHARAAVLIGLNLFLVQLHHAFIMCHQTACARCCTDRFKLFFCPISPCFHYLHERAAVQQTGLNLFSCSSAVYCKFFTQTRVRTEVIFSLVPAAICKLLPAEGRQLLFVVKHLCK
jgi:hypothetical protein